MSLDTNDTVARALCAYVQSTPLGGVLLSTFTGTFKGDVATPVPLTFASMIGEIGEDGAIPEEFTKLTMPAIVFATPRSDRPTSSYDVVPVSIIAITTPDETNAPTRVQARTGWLAAFFAEDNLDGIRDDLNAPLSGPDTRPVKGLVVVGITYDGRDYAENGHQVFSSVKLTVSACGIPDP